MVFYGAGVFEFARCRGSVVHHEDGASFQKDSGRKQAKFALSGFLNGSTKKSDSVLQQGQH